MKSERGITLVSIAMYVIVVIIVTGILAVITTTYGQNILKMNKEGTSNVETDKFGLYFLREVKTEGNEISSISEGNNEIEFTTGNKYTFKQDSNNIYLNDNIKIASNIEECTFESKLENGKTIVTVKIKAEDTEEKSTEYVLANQEIASSYENELNYVHKNANISTTKSYIGCYANLDEDEEPEGIIYADLAVDGGGEWGSNGNGGFSWTAQTEGLKQYKITGQSDAFGGVKRDVIIADPDSEGEPRFYVMAIEDVDEERHYWYNSANGNLNDLVEPSENDFGKGKENTKTMIDKWENFEYGIRNENDMWEIIQKNDEFSTVTVPDGKWFVPSKAEWAAFGWLVSQPVGSESNGFGVDTSNYESDFGLKPFYWSSSQNDSGRAYTAYFYGNYMHSFDVYDVSFVRLSATF